MQSLLHTTTIQRRGGGCGAVQTAMAIGEQQHGVAMHAPETAQQLVCCLRQGYEAIFVALGIADVYAPALTGSSYF